MNRRYNSNSDDLEELLWRAEAVLAEPEEEPYDDAFDLDEYAPEGLDDDEGIVFQNYANSYGEEEPPYRPSSKPYREPPRYDEYRDDYEPPHRDVQQRAVVYEDAAPAQKRKRPRRRRRGCGCGCFTVLLVLALVIAGAVAAVSWFVSPPESDYTIGARKDDTATILICGTDEDGTRTDTMMLMYLSGSENRISLLSLPRDTYTITSAGKAAKLNSAYGRNGTGHEGMDVLLDYVKNIIGYRPDGYILVDFTLVPQIVDIMGGVDIEVPMDMEVASVALEAGYQHLTGRQLMTLLRFRKGYATADLGRVEMQRTVLKACMDQWLSVAHISDALEAISLLESGSISSLDTGNYLWVAKTLLTSLKDFSNDTLPGYAEYRNDVSYYVLNKSEVAALIDSSYNPYEVAIRPEDLKIAE